MINTTELAIAQRLLKALEAYGLTPNEVGADIQLVNTVTGGLHYPLTADGVGIAIETRKITDPKRAGEVSKILRTFVDDLVENCGIDRKSGLCRESGSGGYGFSCSNIAKSSLRQGPDRAVDDMTYGLDNMIKNKEKTFAARFSA